MELHYSNSYTASVHNGEERSNKCAEHNAVR
jgi:hypothetical protein